MNGYLLRKVFNSPIKKCEVTRSFYPASFMVRMIETYNSEGDTVMIPDNMYSKFDVGHYVLCRNDVIQFFIQKHKKHSKFPVNMVELINEDLKYCNRILIRKMMRNNLFEFVDGDYSGNREELNSIVIFNSHLKDVMNLKGLDKCIFKWDLNNDNNNENLFYEEIEDIYKELKQMHDGGNIKLPVDLYLIKNDDIEKEKLILNLDQYLNSHDTSNIIDFSSSYSNLIKYSNYKINKTKLLILSKEVEEKIKNKKLSYYLENVIVIFASNILKYNCINYDKYVK